MRTDEGIFDDDEEFDDEELDEEHPTYCKCKKCREDDDDWDDPKTRYPFLLP